MKTDKVIMSAFQEHFNTGGLFTEKNVLVLMGMARHEERSSIASTISKRPVKSVMDYQCPYTEESCIKLDSLDMTKIDCRRCKNYEI